MSLVKVFVERAQVDKVRSRPNPITGELEFQQKIWVYKSGSRFPIEMEIRLPSGVKFYQEGDYVLDLSTNLAPDKYASPSFAPFSTYSLTPVTPAFLEAFDKLNSQLYDQLKKAA